MNNLCRSSLLATAFLLPLVGCARAQNGVDQPLEVEVPNETGANLPPRDHSATVAPAPFDLTVWRAGQSGALKLSGPLQGYSGPLVVRDFAGKTVWNGQATAGTARVALPISSPGLYTLEAGDVRLSFSVIPAPKPESQQVKGRMHVGLNTHFGPRDAPIEMFRMLQTASVDSVRDEIGWGPSEKQKGVFQFLPRHHEYTAKLKQHGIPLHFSASYGNPLYPQVARYPAAGAAPDYARYVTEVLKKFGDNIIAVEVLNEPNKLPAVKDYLPVLRATHQAVRKAGFKQPVVAIGGAGPAGGGMVPGYARAVFNAAKPNGPFAEGFSIHPYMAPFTPDIGYTPANGMANLDAALTRAGNVVEDYNLKGSWITELGWSGIEAAQTPTPEDWTKPISARTMVSEPKQAAFTARTLLVAAKYPHLRAIYLYDFQDDGPLPLRREHRFGLVRQDLQPKMGFQAFAVAADFLRDKTFVREFGSDDSLLRGLLFRDTVGEHWLAAWTLEETPQTAKDVIAAKAKVPPAQHSEFNLPPRHMENENHVRFRVQGARALGGSDWQGAPVQFVDEVTATSLPVYLRVGRDASKVDLEVIESTLVKKGTEGYPLEEVERLRAQMADDGRND